MPSKKIKIILLSLLGIVIVLVVIALITAPSQPAGPAAQNNEQPAAALNGGTVTEPAPPPVFQESERRFEVLSIGENDAYRVRELSSQKELDIFLPQGAIVTAGSIKNIKAGTILTAQRFVELANGLMVTELSISTAE